MSKKRKDKNQNNDQNNKNNNFFNSNPLLVFAIFSVVTILAFKTIFPQEEGMSTGNANINAYGKTQHKKVAYSDLKQLIETSKIEYVGIGSTSIKAVSKSNTGMITYTARRVTPDSTLIPALEKNKIAYGGINEENFVKINSRWYLFIWLTARLAHDSIF